jgi:AcrR family transcriptional regulator
LTNTTSIPGPSDRRKKRPRAWGSLDRAQIVAAALDIARAEGIKAMTIRRVSEKTGASRMALYRHVRDKQELLELVADEISWQAIPRKTSDTDNWRDRLRAIAYGLRKKFEANPAFLELIILRPTHGRGAVAMSELMTRAIASTGLPAKRVVHYTLVFTDIVLGRIQREISGDPTRGARNKPLVDAAVASGEAPYVTRYESEWRNVEPDDVFAAEVEMVITAIQAEQDANAR